MMSSSIEPRMLQLSGSLRVATIWMIAIAVLPLLAMLVVAILFKARIVTGTNASSLPVIALAGPLILAAVMALLIFNLRRAGVRIEGESLVVNTGVGSKRVTRASLRGSGLRIVDLHERTELKPLFKLWGTGLPGFSGGWFRLRNGEKAVCLLLDRRQVSYLRSDADNLSLLLSLAEPDNLRAWLEP